MFLNKEYSIGGKWQYSKKPTKEQKELEKTFNKFVELYNKQEGNFEQLRGSLKQLNKISLELAYWRKANAIHRWFVFRVGDGDNDTDIEVSYLQLRRLYNLCKKVLNESILVDGLVSNGKIFKDGEMYEQKIVGKIIKNPEIAKELLPTQEGFFFGSTEYDEWYLQTLQDTMNQLEPILEEYSEDDWFTYNSSW